MRIARAVPLEDAEIGILGRNLRCERTESGTLFHALKDEVNAEALAALHIEAIRPDVILLLHVFLLHVGVGPLERNAVVTRESFYPAVVFVRALAQDLFGNGIDAVNVTKEMNDVFRTRQQRQISLNDHAIETVIYQNQQVAEQLAKGFHRSSFPDSSDNKILGQKDRWNPEWRRRKGCTRAEGMAKSAPIDACDLSAHGWLPTRRIVRADHPNPVLLLLYHC